MLISDWSAYVCSSDLISVTDRCDLRCRYCMSEAMSFMPWSQILSLEEIAQLADAFIARGVRKIRLTGGEPLIRPGIPDLARIIGRPIETGSTDALSISAERPVRKESVQQCRTR